MLVNTKQFAVVEKALTDNGALERFEKENGKIKGRMMITVIDIPEEIPVTVKGKKSPVGFDCSFDFYDSSIGLALYTDTKEAASGFWVTQQVQGAEQPSQEWIEFFIKTLIENIEEDGSFGYPMYSFLADESDLTVVPTI